MGMGELALQSEPTTPHALLWRGPSELAQGRGAGLIVPKPVANLQDGAVQQSPNGVEGRDALALLDRLFGEQEGWLALFSGERGGDGKLVSPQTDYLRLPDEREAVPARLDAFNAAEREAWFCAHLLTERKRKKENASPLSALYADVDEAPIPNGGTGPERGCRVQPKDRRKHSGD